MSLFQKPMVISALALVLFFVNPIVTLAQTVSAPNRSSIYELPVGTRIRLKMDNEVNSKSSSLNDTFTATVIKPINVENVTVLPIGAIIEGRVIEVKSASSAGKAGKLDLRFESIQLRNNFNRNIDAVLVKKLANKSSKTKNVISIIGGTLIGALIGVFSKTDKGVLIGASAGAGVGTGTTLLRKGKEVRIKANEVFEIKLRKKVTLPAEGF